MERITDKEKARKITIKLKGEIGKSPHSRQAIEESILKMAEWKEDQIFGMLEKLGYESALTAVKQLMSAKIMEE